MFLRIGCCIKYCGLEPIEKRVIVKRWYEEVLSKLDDKEKKTIIETDILGWFCDNIERYDNIRILKTKIEQAIFDKLTSVYILNACIKDK